MSPRRSSADNTLYVGGGIAVALVVIVSVLLGSAGSRDSGRKVSRKLAGAKKSPAVSSATRAPTLPQSMPPIRAPEMAPVMKPAAELEPSTEPSPNASVVANSPPAASPISQSSPLPPWVNELVQTHCLSCHDARKQEAGLRMDELRLQPLAEQSARHWQKVLERLSNQDMPPPETNALNKADRDRWLVWLRAEIQLVVDSGPARPTVRRLNRAEYINSVQALTGVFMQADLVVEDVVSSGFDTDAAELNLSPALLQRYVRLGREVAVDLRKQTKPLPGQAASPFGNSSGLDSAAQVEEEATRRLRQFATAAFRRPVEEEKLKRLVRIVVDKVSNGQTFDDGMQLAVQAVLCSPQFLLLSDLEEVKDEYALASKLSYFLWSGPPDDTLLKLAEKNELQTGENLREQVTRMLRDPKSRGLADNFGGQWLGTRELGVMQPDEEVFPQYSPLVEASLREETHLYFDHLLRNNLSIEKFLDSDFVFVNEPLAALYGIPNIKGNVFRKVTLKPMQHRGGVLTQGTMLSITSDGVRSSPVVRGVWILENILGDPPPPPPSDVPDLEADTRGTKTIREELARHRHIESCNSCHRKIDPLGFALENYDAIGQWRTHYAAANPPQIPVDNLGELPDGTKVAGVTALKRVLLSSKREFAHCLAEKLFSYACSRKVELGDEESVERIVQAVEADGYRFQALIQAIVHSSEFRGLAPR